MKILVISGSPRDNASSLNVAHYAQNQLNEIQDVQADLFDLNTCTLDFWSGSSSVDEKAQEMIDKADGYVFSVPEWHGMVPPAFKNLFHYFNGLFAHKPAYIIGISSGTGGRYPITELRSTTYKNSFINYIPVSTVLDHVDNTINADAEYIAESDYMAQRLDEGFKFLTAYTNALLEVRKTDIYQEKRFKNGL